MKLSGFKESIFSDPKFNPPARVSKAISPKRQKLLQVLQYVKGGILKLLDQGILQERSNYSHDYRDLEPIIFPETCSFVCHFLEKNGVKFEKGVPRKKCGTEGCAYFYDDKVLKCTFGKQEWEIATLLKGDKNIVPVIDTSKEPKTGTYLILSWTLDVRSSFLLEEELNLADAAIANWFHDDKISTWSGSDDDLEKLLDLRNFQEFARNRYQGRYRGEAASIVNKLFQIVVQIFRKSGYFLSQDNHSQNIGFTAEKNPQIFDFGYPRKLGVEYNPSSSSSQRS